MVDLQKENIYNARTYSTLIHYGISENDLTSKHG